MTGLPQTNLVQPVQANNPMPRLASSSEITRREHVLRDILGADLFLDAQNQIQGFIPMGGLDSQPVAIEKFFESTRLNLVGTKSNIALNLRFPIFNSLKPELIASSRLRSEYHELFANEDAYTDWGKELKSLIKGKDFIDFCSQVPSSNFFPGLIADKFGAKSYTAIDLDDDMLCEFKPAVDSNSCPHISIKSCILSFIRKMKAGANNRVLFFSGAEANSAYSWNRLALDELTKKLGEVSKKGDVLIFDENTSRNLIGGLVNYGFKPKLETNGLLVKFSVWEKTE